MFPGDGSGKFQDNVSDLAAMFLADMLSGFPGTKTDKTKGWQKCFHQTIFLLLLVK